MTQRRKRSLNRATKSAPKKPSPTTIDTDADYQDLASQHQAMSVVANRLAAELNEVQVTLTKLQGAMEYLRNRGAQTPNVEDPDQKQQPTE